MTLLILIILRNACDLRLVFSPPEPALKWRTRGTFGILATQNPSSEREYANKLDKRYVVVLCLEKSEDAFTLEGLRVNSFSPPEAPLNWQTRGTSGILATQVTLPSSVVSKQAHGALPSLLVIMTLRCSLLVLDRRTFETSAWITFGYYAPIWCYVPA
jgi:hypothetical protein